MLQRLGHVDGRSAMRAQVPSGFPVTAHLLVTGPGGRLLLLRSATDPARWQLPGGIVEQGESPHAAALRETREETGLSLDQLDTTRADLLTVAWIAASGPGRRDRLALVFAGPRLEPAELDHIRPDGREVDAWQLAEPATAHHLLRPLMAHRLQAAVGTGGWVYLEQRPGGS
jgi:8-oxo-dGTP diphosphatase